MDTTKKHENPMYAIGKEARIGLYFLKEAVLQTLFNARDEVPLQPDDIRKLLGIPKTNNPSDRTNTLIFNILSLLKNEGRIEVITKEGSGWKITEAGASSYMQKRIII